MSLEKDREGSRRGWKSQDLGEEEEGRVMEKKDLRLQCSFEELLANLLGRSQAKRLPQATKDLPASAGDTKDSGFNPWVRKM